MSLSLHVSPALAGTATPETQQTTPRARCKTSRAGRGKFRQTLQMLDVGFRIQGLGFRIQDLGLRFRV